MTYREMTATDIAKRIGQGDLVVYVEEEYGFRRWFWFPDMSESDLAAYWQQCNIEDHFFNPSNLPGDMVPVPPEEVDEDEIDSYYDRAMADPRCQGIICPRFQDRTDEEAIAAYDEWQGDWFPNEAMWYQGWRSQDTWRAHTHMADDSFLRRPGE